MTAAYTFTVGELLIAATVVVGLLWLLLAELRDVNRRLAHTRLMLFTLIQDLHFIHRLPMSSFPDVLEGVGGSPDDHDEAEHGRQRQGP